MYGFTESYNLSVSVAMTFYTLVSRLHQSDIKWQLDDQRKEQLRLQWYKKIVKNSQIIEKEFLASLN
jgi:tRNA (guanosine-2'-O-)-methyltransferase